MKTPTEARRVVGIWGLCFPRDAEGKLYGIHWGEPHPQEYHLWVPRKRVGWIQHAARKLLEEIAAGRIGDGVIFLTWDFLPETP